MPLVIHETDQVSDYGVGAFTCTATAAVAQAQHTQQVLRPPPKDRPDPARWTTWIHYPLAAGGPHLEPLEAPEPLD